LVDVFVCSGVPVIASGVRGAFSAAAFASAFLRSTYRSSSNLRVKRRVREFRRTLHAFRVSIGNERAHTVSMSHEILGIPDIAKKKRDLLKTKRDSLFNEYTMDPHNHHLALEIKTIDDAIADCILQEQKSFESPRVRR
jgi:hypothetical protein